MTARKIAKSQKSTKQENLLENPIKLNKDVTEFILDNSNKEITYQDLINVFHNGNTKRKTEIVTSTKSTKRTSTKVTTLACYNISSITETSEKFKINLNKKAQDIDSSTLKHIMNYENMSIFSLAKSDDSIAEAFISKMEERVSSYGDDLGFEYLCGSYMRGSSLRDIVLKNIFIVVA